jgi:hypothetical protein
MDRREMRDHLMNAIRFRYKRLALIHTLAVLMLVNHR